jgi:hypothetical protein
MQVVVNQVNDRLYCIDMVAALTGDGSLCNSIWKMEGRVNVFIMHDLSLHKEVWIENLYFVTVCMHAHTYT